MFLRNFLLFILAFIPCIISSQEAKNRNLGSCDNVLIEQKIDSIVNTHVSYSVHKIFKKELFPIALQYYKNKEFGNFNQTLVYLLSYELLPEQRAKVFYYLGRSYYKQHLFQKSIDLFEKVIENNSSAELSAKAYMELARCFRQLGDYENSIKHYEISHKLLAKSKNFSFLLASYMNTAQVYQQLETFEGAKQNLKFWQKADSLIQLSHTSNSRRYLVKIGLGEAYSQESLIDIKQASYNFNKALEIAEKSNDTLKIADTYSYWGELYNTNAPALAIEYQQKSIELNKEVDSVLLFHNYLNISYCYGIQQNFNDAIHTLNRALKYVLDHDILKGKDQLIKSFIQSPYKDVVLLAIKDLASHYLNSYKQGNNEGALLKAKSIYQLADQLIDLLRIESREFQSKLFWRKQSSELYGKAIEVCFLADDAELAFYFMEKSKSLLLINSLKNQQLRQVITLPDSLVDQENDLKSELYVLRHSTSYNSDSISIVQLAKERRLKNLQVNLAKKYKFYTPSKLETPLVSLSDVQSSLKVHTAVLMYNISEYSEYRKITSTNAYVPVLPNSEYGIKTFYPAYGLLITTNNIKFFKLQNSEDLGSKVQNLISQIKEPFISEKDFQTYSTAAYEIYENLLPKNDINELLNGKKILIIPDNYLHFLPFEALKTTTGTNSKYWLEDNEISYAYSNSFLQNIPTEIRNEQLSFAGFAPVSFLESHLNSLPNSLDEIRQCGSYFNADNFTEEEATKENFLLKMSQSDIIHLATHADAQDSIAPWIAFRDSNLLQEELALTTSNAQLAVLSGCNTLLGEQKLGEGVMSLARGFFHAGAKSVVSSLWSVNDYATTDLMSDFYKNINLGKDKSYALRAAKLNYLQNHKGSESSPYYWASFVLLGNDSALVKVDNHFFWWWILITVCSIVFVWYYVKK